LINLEKKQIEHSIITYARLTEPVDGPRVGIVVAVATLTDLFEVVCTVTDHDTSEVGHLANVAVADERVVQNRPTVGIELLKRGVASLHTTLFQRVQVNVVKYQPIVAQLLELVARH
jgi:hypothetical protein